MSFGEMTVGANDGITPVEGVPVVSETASATPVDELARAGHEELLLRIVEQELQDFPPQVAAEALATVDETMTPSQRSALQAVKGLVEAIRSAATRAATFIA